MSKKNPVEKFFHESHEFVEAIVKASADSKIKGFEALVIGIELVQVFKAAPAMVKHLKGFENFSEQELRDLALSMTEEMEHIDKSVNIDDLIDMMLMIQPPIRIFNRHKK